MITLVNLENALVVAAVSPIYLGSKTYAMFHVTEQTGEKVKVNIVGNLKQTDNRGEMDYGALVPKELYVDEICLCVNALNPTQKSYLDKLGISYRFHKDEDALERLAGHLDMDLIHIGYEGESDKGTWFTCCRIDPEIRKILPQGLYVYSLRASDIDDSQPCMIDENVLVNHYGDILVDHPLPVSMKLEVEQVEYDDDGCIVG